MQENSGVTRLDELLCQKRHIEDTILAATSLLVKDHRCSSALDDYWIGRLETLITALDANDKARSEVCKTILGVR